MVDSDWLLNMVWFLLNLESMRLGEKALVGEALYSLDPCLDNFVLVGEMLLFSDSCTVKARVLDHE